MPVQAIPLALIASVYPIGIAALLVLFHTTRARARSAAFLAGAAMCTLGVGFAVVIVIRGAGLHHSDQQTPRYALRLSVGVLLMIVAWLISRRQPNARRDRPSRVTELLNSPNLWPAFFLGILLYTPSPAYLTALQIVGTTKLDTASTVIWVFIVVATVLLTLELPVLLFALAPGWTVPKLDTFDSWLTRRGRELLIGALVVLGIWQAVDGLVGLLT